MQAVLSPGCDVGDTPDGFDGDGWKASHRPERRSSVVCSLSKRDLRCKKKKEQVGRTEEKEKVEVCVRERE